MSEKQRAKKAVGIGTTIYTFFQEHPDQPVTIDQLMKLYPDWTRTQLNSAVYNLNLRPYVNLETLSAGVWRLNTTTAAPTTDNGREKITIELLKETDEYSIGLDDDGNVYKITLLG